MDIITKKNTGRKNSESTIELMSALKKDFYATPRGAEVKKTICNLNKGKMPYQMDTVLRSRELVSKWSRADYYYQLWVEYDRPRERKFQRLVEKVIRESFRASYFKRMIQKFDSGWIPFEDYAWHNFNRNTTTTLEAT
jgi:hypothetical protein